MSLLPVLPLPERKGQEREGGREGQGGAGVRSERVTRGESWRGRGRGRGGEGKRETQRENIFVFVCD